MASAIFGKDDLFVAPNGNDRWSGTLPKPNKKGSDGPLATLQEAQKRIRQRKGLLSDRFHDAMTGGIAQPFTIWIRGGQYSLSEPLVFTPQDSAPVTFKAYPREKPIIEAARRINGWKTTKINGKKAWVADLPEVREGKRQFRQLFVNGEGRPRPRLPREGLFGMKSVPGLPDRGGWGPGGYTRFESRKGDVKAFKNLNDIEVVYVHFWIEERSPIAAFDPRTNMVTMARESRAPLFGAHTAHGANFADYYLDNVVEGLENPGEWYLDRQHGKLYYLPKKGETIENTDICAPQALQLIVLKGNPEESRYVEFLRFEGLTFRFTDWRHPDASDAEIDFVRPSGEHSGFESRRHYRGRSAAAAQAACDVPGVIFMEAARHCAVADCTIEHVGWYGIEIADACFGISVVGNTIREMGAGGVKINGSSVTDPRIRRTGNHRITDNTIHTGGRVFHSAVGILSMNAHNCDLSHNHIHDLYYTGISCGWVWGYKENVSRDNRIEKNHIHDIGQGLLSDMGGIYTLGVQPGTVIRGNLIHDITKAHYGAWCIYPDEGSSHILIENNVCYRTNDSVFHQHYGRENIVRNNIFAFGDAAILAHGRADLQHRAMNFERNLLLTEGAPIFQAGYGCSLESRNHGSDLNVIWDVRGQPFQFSRKGKERIWDLKEWQTLGHDLHSVFDDPKCRDPLKGDFKLAKNSPAHDLGFQPIDLSDVGPRPRSKR